MSLYPTTVAVPDHLRSWSTPWPDYAPVDITPDELRGDSTPDWAEPGADPTVLDWEARRSAALISFEVIDGKPRNPGGRTGRCGRNLRSWGENACVDAVLVAGHGSGRQVLLIQREDTGQWAAPGGHVEPGEVGLLALIRELREETGIDLDTLSAWVGADPVYRVLLNAVVVDRLLVDDPRATDESWIATTVALLPLLAPVPAVAGDDAMDARWWDFVSLGGLQEQLEAAGEQLYPAHLELLGLVEEHLDIVDSAEARFLGGEVR